MPKKSSRKGTKAQRRRMNAMFKALRLCAFARDIPYGFI
jgi:hypothetical protein